MSASSSMAGGLGNEDRLDGTIAAAQHDYDVGLLRSYLELLLPVVLSASDRTITNTMFSRSSQWKETLEAFASEPSIAVLYVNKIRAEVVMDDAEDDGKCYILPEEMNLLLTSTSIAMFTYSLSTQATYTPLHVSSIALIKRVSTLDSNRSLPSQLHLLSLFGPASAASTSMTMTNGDLPNGNASTSVRESPYEALHSVVHNVMAPWFDAYVLSKEGKEKVSTSVKSKDADIKMGE